MNKGAGGIPEITLSTGFREELRVSLGGRESVTVEENSVLLLLTGHNGYFLLLPCFLAEFIFFFSG